MKKSILKGNELLTIMDNSLIKLPTPSNISYYWNTGSTLGICLIIQILSGLFLSMHYCPNTEMAFNSIIHICQEVNYGFLIRNIHMNGASLYFMCMFIHMGRGIYYQSFTKTFVWISGVTILILSMAAAFMGYILPWGQMSFWGATVITNLISTIPYLGNTMVMWIWGGFSINNATLNRFYSLHFIIPLIITALVIIHLFMLHVSKSSNPVGLKSLKFMSPFHPYFTIKDSLTFILLIMLLMILVLQYPFLLSDPDNFTMANSMITPIHIQPEWYFLFAYAILRSIPNKLGGVIALTMSIMIFYILPFNFNMNMNSNMQYPINQTMYWTFIMSFFLLTWTGAKPIENPFIIISQMNSIIYFLYLIVTTHLNSFWDMIIYEKD